MLLLVLILVLIAFGLLVVALLSGSVLWAWVSVGVSVAAAAVLLIDWLLSLTLLGGLRMSVRIIGEARQRAQRLTTRGGVKRVIVAGAGDAGTMFVRELQRNPQLGIVPIGFLDDAAEKQRKSISGVRATFAGWTHGIDEMCESLPTRGPSF